MNSSNWKVICHQNLFGIDMQQYGLRMPMFEQTNLQPASQMKSPIVIQTALSKVVQPSRCIWANFNKAFLEGLSELAKSYIIMIVRSRIGTYMDRMAVFYKQEPASVNSLKMDDLEASLGFSTNQIKIHRYEPRYTT